MSVSLWSLCLRQLEGELSAQEFNTWIRPLQMREEGGTLRLSAPNRFVLDWVKQHFLERITSILTRINRGQKPALRLQISTRRQAETAAPVAGNGPVKAARTAVADSPLNPKFTFRSFVPGRTNQLACAASMQAAQNSDFNPLFIYGGVGLGKTHLMQAVGHLVRERRPDAKVVYLHSERFVANMVKALQNKTIADFKQYYRSANVLLVDDIQFLAGKTQSQEEFFHTFNSLLEGSGQVVLTSDRLPQELGGLDERLRSRLGSGLSVGVQAPELETRVAILQRKAMDAQAFLPEDVAAYIAEHVASNIRELEGALHRLLASARFLESPIDLALCREALKDILVQRAKMITVQDIQKAVAEYYNLSLNELNSKRRQRHIVRPRQIAMSLAKDLTRLSVPEIGNAFDRDRTTVLHSCKTIASLKTSDSQLQHDYSHLQSLLSTG